jgi:hypothetical protein
MRRLVAACAFTALAALLVAVSATVSESAPPPRSTTLSAVVNVDGSLARGNGAVSSASLGVDGQYEVIFDRDVTQCAYVAVGGEATDFGADDAITIGVSRRQGNPNGVFLIEYDAILMRDSYSSGFHLIVNCP